MVPKSDSAGLPRTDTIRYEGALEDEGTLENEVPRDVAPFIQAPFSFNRLGWINCDRFVVTDRKPITVTTMPVIMQTCTPSSIKSTP